MSLRARLLLGMGIVAVVLTSAAFVVVRTTRADLVSQVDAQLTRSRQMGIDGRRGADPLSSFYVAAVNRTGEVVVVFTPNITDDEVALPAIDGAIARHAAGTGEPYTVAAVDGDLRYRVLARPARAGFVEVVALPLRDVDDATARLITVMAVAVLGVVVVLALVTWWVLRLGVRPVKQMTATASAIAAGSLSHRVPDQAPGTEARELGTALNQMLERLEGAFDERTRSEERLRRFVADASHELRTPVTTIRGYAELYRAGGLSEGTELDEAMRRTEQEAVRMGALVDDLLHLARLDQGRPLERAPVDLAVVARDAVRDARAVEPDRPIDLRVAASATVLGDDARLRQVVGNLLANARVHTPPDTPVLVQVDQRDGVVVLEVRDEGPGMAPADAARAFERFFRADPSRSRHRGGSGLGLSIVDATVQALGGEVDLETAPGRGTTVRVTLPAAGGSG